MFTAFSKPVVMLSNTTKPRAFSKSPKHPTQAGFTLLELLVVITLLGIISGSVVLAYQGVQEQGRQDNTDFEMSEIRKALLQFRRDSGSKDFPGDGIYDCDDSSNGGNATDANTSMTFPPEAGATDVEKIAWCQSPANFWMLFLDPLGNGWNPDTKRGWNGPYLRNRQMAVDYLTQTALAGITDPYGNPYLLQDMVIDNEARIISMGENASYGGKNSTNACLANDADDRVLCFLR